VPTGGEVKNSVVPEHGLNTIKKQANHKLLTRIMNTI